MSTAAEHLKAAAACLLNPTQKQFDECRLEFEAAITCIRELRPAERAGLRPLVRRASRLLHNAAALQFGGLATLYDSRGAINLNVSTGRLSLEA